eukprot:4655699-Pyramimonas_sp.AAC.1
MIKPSRRDGCGTIAVTACPRVSGVLSAHLPLLAQENPKNEVTLNIIQSFTARRVFNRLAVEVKGAGEAR